ncbi:unnamed protein product [Bursaphelenchus okinawaensis]|uniref:Uncharacterized protein n=1 Tax=Bursaphelenchus okinawaensis TaxID=465554 RepID=A0A811KT55_9BILA|nr:unnamed protein product [Bursaphelenchus okinawaensis]CAG9109587.1 unnamed protein product [Bursaphelenchus okinawaensis]
MGKCGVWQGTENTEYADPYYGICHPGMDFVPSGVLVYVPALILSILLLAKYYYLAGPSTFVNLSGKTGPAKPVRLGRRQIAVLNICIVLFFLALLTYHARTSTTPDQVSAVRGAMQLNEISTQSLEMMTAE